MHNFNVLRVIPVFVLNLIPSFAMSQNIPRLSDILDVTHEATVGNFGFFGSTAAIEFGDGTRWHSATGVTGPKGSSQGGRTLAVDDRFHIGSQTKTYTGTVVMKLIDAGAISFDDTIEDWYIRQPYAMQAVSVMSQDLRKAVTVHDLLSMRTGIPEPLGGADPYTPSKTILDVWNAKLGRYDLTIQQMLVASLAQGSTMKVGDESTFEYSNVNFMLAAMIAEAATCELGACKTIRELITVNVIEAEGLENTLYPVGTEWGSDKHTNGTWDYYGADGDFTYTSPSVPNAAGAMISDVDDQLTWLVEVTTNRRGTLSAATFDERLRRTRTMDGMVGLERAGYGLALYGQHSLDTGAFMLGHGGEISGYQTLMFRYPGKDTTETDDLFIVANVNTFLNVPNSRIFGAADVHNMFYDLQRSTVMYDAFEAAPDGCKSDGNGIVCSATTLADTTMPVFNTRLTMQPSGQRWVAPAVEFDEAVPTWVFSGNDNTGVAATASVISVEEGARFIGYGNGMTLLALGSAQNGVTIDGEMTVIGKDATAINASAASDDRIAISAKGVVSGNILATDGADHVAVAGTLNGDVTLGREAQLTGAGSIQGMISGEGTLIPGTEGEAEPSALNVTRYEAKGGTLEIAVFGAQGSATSLLVDQQLSEGFKVPQTGIATLGSGVLRLTGTRPTDDQMILLLHAENGIIGKFAKVDDPMGILTTQAGAVQTDILYTKNSVFLRARLK